MIYLKEFKSVEDANAHGSEGLEGVTHIDIVRGFNKFPVNFVKNENGDRFKCSFDENGKIIATKPSVQETYKIYYTTIDGKPVSLNFEDEEHFGANVIDNRYRNGQGCITLEGVPTKLCGDIIEEEGQETVYTPLFGSTLQTINIPTSVTIIGVETFDSCALTNITIPDSVTSIGDRAFYGCTLNSITIPNSVTTIGDWAFQECFLLSEITLPSSITSISEYMLANCSNLDNVIIPTSITNIEEGAFYECATEITYLGTKAQFETITKVEDWSGNVGVIHCTDGDIIFANLIDTYPTGTKYEFSISDTSNLLSSVITDNVTSIPDNAYSNCSNLTSITISTSVTIIGQWAFSYCSALKTITIPDSVTSITGGYQFYYCTSLTSATLGSGITATTFYMFSNCTALKTITIPESIKTITYNTFWYCYSLTGITIQSTVTNIGDSAFGYCSGLTQVICEATTPPSIGYSVFYNTNDCPIYVSFASVDTYKAATNWSSYASRIQAAYTPDTYKSLSITADDVNGRKTATTIHYTYVTDGYDFITGTRVSDISITGNTTSDSFPQNTSTTETVQRTITYSGHGLTATTTITQGVWTNQYYKVDLNGEWITGTKNPDSSTYEQYMSNSNYHVNNGYACMKITFWGYTAFTIYINSYAESNYDYTIAFNADLTKPTSLPSYTTSGVKVHTRGYQYSPSGSVSTNYKTVTYNTDGGEHYCWICYRKDSSSHSYDDRGYVLIPKI